MTEKRNFWMLIICIVPLLALFLLPVAGLGTSPAITGFLIFMLGCHLIHMMMHRAHHKP